MESGSILSRRSRKQNRGGLLDSKPDGLRLRVQAGDQQRGIRAVDCLPDSIRATIVVRRGEYDSRRLRSQCEIIRDVMLAAADCDTWLTLAELRALTHFGEASISAQLRHLRRSEHGAYDVTKRRREDIVTPHIPTDRRGDLLWEYRIAQPSGDGSPAFAEGGVHA